MEYVKKDDLAEESAEDVSSKVSCESDGEEGSAEHHPVENVHKGYAAIDSDEGDSSSDDEDIINVGEERTEPELDTTFEVDTNPIQQPLISPHQINRPHTNTTELSDEVTSTDMKYYMCEVCLKTFKQNTHLLEHQSVHSNAIPSDCKYCLKKFKHSGDLTRHQLFHNDNNQFHCDYCAKSFKRKGYLYLAKHELTHTGVKKFQCYICQKMFAQSGHQINHQRTHAGDCTVRV